MWAIWLALSMAIMCFAAAQGMKIHAITTAWISAGLIIMQPINAIFPVPSLFFAESILWLSMAYRIRKDTFPALAIFASAICYLGGYIFKLQQIPFGFVVISADLFGAAALLWIVVNMIGKRFKDVFVTDRDDKFSIDPAYRDSHIKSNPDRPER